MKIQLTFLDEYKKRQWHNQAIDRAYERFCQQHPAWVGSLFDRHFLDHAAAGALRDPLGVLPIDLAEAWAKQFGVSHEVERRAERRAMPAAGALIRLFRAELDASFTQLPLRLRAV